MTEQAGILPDGAEGEDQSGIDNTGHPDGAPETALDTTPDEEVSTPEDDGEQIDLEGVDPNDVPVLTGEDEEQS